MGEIAGRKAMQRAHRRSMITAVGAFLVCATILMPSRLRAHATLIASQPAANARLSESPATIHLTFSEEVVPRLCQIRIVTATGEKIELSVVGDPHNVRAVSGTPARLEAGSYTVEWRVLSADGHPAQGSFAFTIGEPPPAVTTVPTPALPAAQPNPDSAAKSGAMIAGAPAPLAALRGAAMVALLGATGLLLLALRGRSAAPDVGARRYCAVLTAAAAFFFVSHFVGWLIHTAPDQRLTSDWATAVMQTPPGIVEGLRTLLVLLAAWGLFAARRTGLAAVFAVSAVVVSGAAGHSAGATPLLSIPLKIIHLVAVSLWFGGLLWIVLSRPADPECMTVARRVSSVALSCVLIILLTGIGQALLLASPSELITSPYGLVLGLKTAAFLILIGFGGFNRFRLIPDIGREECRVRLRASAARESTLMVVVLLLAGLLAYVPTPQTDTHTAAIQSGAHAQ